MLSQKKRSESQELFEKPPQSLEEILAEYEDFKSIRGFFCFSGNLSDK